MKCISLLTGAVILIAAASSCNSSGTASTTETNSTSAATTTTNEKNTTTLKPKGKKPAWAPHGTDDEMLVVMEKPQGYGAPPDAKEAQGYAAGRIKSSFNK